MMTLSHSVVGAALGRFSGNPVLAFFVGVIAHIFFDKIPHYWPKTKDGQKNVQRFEWVTIPILTILVYYFGIDDPLLMLSGLAGGAIVDLVIVCIPLVLNSRLGKWHHKRQPHSTDPRYLVVDFLMILVFSILVFFI